jgi:hypothetical protein
MYFVFWRSILHLITGISRKFSVTQRNCAIKGKKPADTIKRNRTQVIAK